MNRSHILASKYVAVEGVSERMALEEIHIHLYRNDDTLSYVMACECGNKSHMTHMCYSAGRTYHGGLDPYDGYIGVVFGPYHRWLILTCSRCNSQQRYEKEEEFQRQRRDTKNILLSLFHRGSTTER